MTRKRLFAYGISVAIVGGLPRGARADEPQRAVEADALFRSGKAALARGDLATACTQLAESQRLDPAIGTLLNLADCEARSQRLVTALLHFQAARDQMASDDFRIPYADERLAEFRRRVPRLVLRMVRPVAGMQILRDGVELRASSLEVPVPVNPGTHTCIVRAPGYVEWKGSVDLAEGEQRTLEVELAPESHVPEPMRTPEPPRTAAWIATGVGATGIVVGAVTGILALNAASTYRDHCDTQGACDGTGLDAASTGRTMTVVSPVAFAIGALGVGVGMYLFLKRPDPVRAVAVVPLVGVGSAGFGLEKRF